MSKFYDLSQPASRTALIDDRGMTLSYGELAQRVQSLAECSLQGRWFLYFVVTR